MKIVNEIAMMKSTKELARQLGLLRRRSTTTQLSRDVKRVNKTNQIFPYLIVIDFESTCWKDRKNVGQEVIEFPAVLLNTSTGCIESEFHTYVLPEEHPQLSAFCTELTGITQAQVEGGIPLRVCLSKFTRWLRKQEEEKNIAYNSGDAGKKLCTFVTWSDWDLSVCLHYECRRKQLLKPSVLNTWLDLRATYKDFYQRKPNGLHGALQDVGIEFLGRQHSGLDDARNTASLAWRMMCDGCTMKITRTMTGPQDLKRKQASSSSEQPTQSTAKPNINTHRRPQPDAPLVDRCTVSEDRLISYTQALSEATVCRDAVLEMSTNAGDFQIWEDGPESGPVRSVINVKTSLPSKITNGRGEDRNKRNELETGLRHLDKTGKGSVSIGNTFSNSGGTDCSALSCSENCGESALRKFCSTVASRDHNPTARGHAMSSTGKGALTTARDSGAHTHSNNTMGRQQASPSPLLKRSSSVVSPAPSSRSTVTLNTPAVFKTPLVTPARGSSTSRKPSPSSSSFKMPNAPGSYQTPGSTIRTTPSNFVGKVTPPMCQCGRRAKRRTVQSPGPNMSRAFFSCTLGRRSSEAGLQDVTNARNGCDYFRWESAVLAEKRQLPSASPVNQSRLPQKRRSVVCASSKINPAGTSSNVTTPVGCTGKRLGIAMRAVLRHQNQMKI